MRSVLLALALAAVPASARAEAAAPVGRFYLTLRAMMLVPQKDDALRGFDDGYALTGAVGARLSRHVHLELGGGRVALDQRQTGLIGGLLAVTLDESVVAYPVTASVRLVAPTSRFELYAIGGGGVYFMSGELVASAPGATSLTQTDSDTPLALHLGAGAAFRLTPRVVLGAEVTYVTGDTDLFLEVFDARTSFDLLSFGATLSIAL